MCLHLRQGFLQGSSSWHKLAPAGKYEQSPHRDSRATFGSVSLMQVLEQVGCKLVTAC